MAVFVFACAVVAGLVTVATIARKRPAPKPVRIRARRDL